MKAIGEASSLRMSIVWALCPKTKQTASNLAKPDGYICSLLRKEDEGKKLTQKEEIVLNNYRKNVWLAQGTDELKEDVKEVFRLYFGE